MKRKFTLDPKIIPELLKKIADSDSEKTMEIVRDFVEENMSEHLEEFTGECNKLEDTLLGILDDQSLGIAIPAILSTMQKLFSSLIHQSDTEEIVDRRLEEAGQSLEILLKSLTKGSKITKLKIQLNAED